MKTKKPVNIQIETITLKSGCKMDVIRDIEKVRKLIEDAEKLAAKIRLLREAGGKMLCEGDAEALKEWDSLYEKQKTKSQPSIMAKPRRVDSIQARAEGARD